MSNTQLHKLVDNLPEIRRGFILELRNRGLTYAQIGKIVNLTRERVRQIANDIPINTGKQKKSKKDV